MGIRNKETDLVRACLDYLALRRIKEEIKAIWYGFGPLEDLLADPTINEIMVVDPDHIFIEKRGQIESSGRRFLTDSQKIIRDIVNGSGREINTSEPLADARLPDGSRINAVIPPLALKGPCLTIRRFPKRRLTIDELIRRGSLTPAARASRTPCQPGKSGSSAGWVLRMRPGNALWTSSVMTVPKPAMATRSTS